MNIEKFLEISQATSFTCSLKTKASNADTLEQARDKVIEKALLNRAYFDNPDNAEEPGATIFYRQYNGCYLLGLKYGNRWLKGIFEGKDYGREIPSENVLPSIDFLIEETKAGVFDNQIEQIRIANANSRSKKAN